MHCQKKKKCQASFYNDMPTTLFNRRPWNKRQVVPASLADQWVPGSVERPWLRNKRRVRKEDSSPHAHACMGECTPSPPPHVTCVHARAHFTYTHIHSHAYVHTHVQAHIPLHTHAWLIGSLRRGRPVLPNLRRCLLVGSEKMGLIKTQTLSWKKKKKPSGAISCRA